jgi:hypothetical protein
MLPLHMSLHSTLMMMLLHLLSAATPLFSLCREVETLFHEFGHALQHMMTTVDEGLVAGIRWERQQLLCTCYMTFVSMLCDMCCST